VPKRIPSVVAARGGTYSEVVEAGDLVFIAGQVGLPPTSTAAETPFEREARATFEAVADALRIVDLGLDAVVRCTVYLTDMARFEHMNRVFREVFPNDRPARTTVGVTALARDCRIEVEATAVR
jgi:2-iminobutanoate/2-iminopropanoate deaminase